MEKVFEDQFMDVQSDMVALCIEYLGKYKDKVEYIYIYGSHENNMFTCGYFFKIHGQMVERHKLHECLPGIDDSGSMQIQVLNLLKQDLMRLDDVCKNNDRPMPTELKLVYNVQTTSLDAKYQYDNIYSETTDKSPGIIEDEWFESLK